MSSDPFTDLARSLRKVHLTFGDLLRRDSRPAPGSPAVTEAEMHLIDVEISIVGRRERVTSPAEIVVGQHGLVVEQDGRKGLLLPQVATEFQWTAERFVEQACLKAGLSRDGWKRGASLWRFEAQVFGNR